MLQFRKGLDGIGVRFVVWQKRRQLCTLILKYWENIVKKVNNFTLQPGGGGGG